MEIERFEALAYSTVEEAVRGVAIDSVPVTESNNRQEFRDGFLATIRRHMGRIGSPFIVRMHHQSFMSHWPNMTGAIIGMSNEAQSAIHWVCHRAHDPSSVSISSTPLQDDENCQTGESFWVTPDT